MRSIIGSFSLLAAAVLCPGAQDAATGTLDTDRQVLRALYEASGGDGWTRNDGWQTDAEDLGGWYGVTVQGGRVTELRLRNNNLVGILPRELGFLTRLEVLDLGENRLEGPLPETIGHLSGLTRLRLQRNRLGGPLPRELGNLERLEYLNLRDNRFTGELPGGLANLGALRGLWLHRNDFAGPLPRELRALSHLEELSLYANPQLHGALPSGLARLQRLETLFFADTQLCVPPDSAFRAWFETVPERTAAEPCLIDADWRALIALYEATDGDEWANRSNWTPNPDAWPSARSVGAWYGVTVSDGRVSSLRLNDNGLSGTLPEELGNLGALRVLAVHHNDLAGPLPESLSELSDLGSLWIDGTNLCLPADSVLRAWHATIPNAPDAPACTPAAAADVPEGAARSAPLIAAIVALALACLGTTSAFVYLLVRARRQTDAPTLAEISQRLLLLDERTAAGREQSREGAEDLLRAVFEATGSARGTTNASGGDYRWYLARFARVDQAAEYFQKRKTAGPNALRQIRRLLADAFAECGLERFEPEVGSDYRFAYGVADHPTLIEAVRPEDDYRIAEVRSAGYFVRNGNDRKVVVPAKVTIFRFNGA